MRQAAGALHGPAGQVDGSERGAVAEHAGHRLHAGDIPVLDRLLGGHLLAAGEHALHVVHAPHVPVGAVGGQRARVGDARVGEHVGHVDAAGRVLENPGGKRADVLELDVAVEHVAEVGDAAHVPATHVGDGLELLATGEEVRKRGGLRGVEAGTVEVLEVVVVVEPALGVGGADLAHEAVEGDGAILVEHSAGLDVLDVGHDVGARVLGPRQIVGAVVLVGLVLLGHDMVAGIGDGAHDQGLVQVALLVVAPPRVVVVQARGRILRDGAIEDAGVAAVIPLVGGDGGRGLVGLHARGDGRRVQGQQVGGGAGPDVGAGEVVARGTVGVLGKPGAADVAVLPGDAVVGQLVVVGVDVHVGAPVDVHVGVGAAVGAGGNRLDEEHVRAEGGVIQDVVDAQGDLVEAGAVEEHVGGGLVVHVPARDVDLLEADGVGEHVGERRSCRGVPEGHDIGVQEHGALVADRHVELAVLVLVDGALVVLGAREHAAEVGHLGGVPGGEARERGDALEVLEHVLHGDGAGDVDADVPVAHLHQGVVAQHAGCLEVLAHVEHGREVRDVAHVPVVQADDLCQRLAAGEHAGQARGVAHVVPAGKAGGDALELDVAAEHVGKRGRVLHVGTRALELLEVAVVLRARGGGVYLGGEPAVGVDRGDLVLHVDLLDVGAREHVEPGHVRRVVVAGRRARGCGGRVGDHGGPVVVREGGVLGDDVFPDAELVVDDAVGDDVVDADDEVAVLVVLPPGVAVGLEAAAHVAGLPAIGEELGGGPHGGVLDGQGVVAALGVALHELAGVAPPGHVTGGGAGLREGLLLPGAVGGLVVHGLVVEARTRQREGVRQGDELEVLEVGQHVFDVVGAAGKHGGREVPGGAREVHLDDGLAAVEHVDEVLDLAGIPAHDAVDDAELLDVAEHGLHGEHVARVPGGELRDVGQGLAAVEHEARVQEGGGIPAHDRVDVAQGLGALEHALGRGDGTRVLAVEGTGGGGKVHLGVPGLETLDGAELDVGLAALLLLVLDGLDGLGIVLDAGVIDVLLGQRAEEALDGAGHIDVHVGDVGLLEVGQAREPVLGVDDVDVAHELDVLDLAALVERVVVAGDVDEPRQLPPALGNPAMVVGIARGVVVEADDERAGVGHELPPCPAVGDELVATGLLALPDVGVDEGLGQQELRTGGVGRDEVVGGAEPRGGRAVARPTTGARGARGKRVAAHAVTAQGGILEHAELAHDQLGQGAVAGEEVGDDGVVRAGGAVVDLPVGDVDLLELAAAGEHRGEVDGIGARGVDADLPAADGVDARHGRAALEHGLEVGDLGDVPAGHVVGVHHGGVVAEHGLGVGERRDVPAQAVGGVDLAHAVEHEGGVGDLGHVPMGHGRDGVEVAAVLEHARGVDEARGVPGAHAHRAMQLVLVLEHVLHRHGVGDVDVGAVELDELGDDGQLDVPDAHGHGVAVGDRSAVEAQVVGAGTRDRELDRVGGPAGGLARGEADVLEVVGVAVVVGLVGDLEARATADVRGPADGAHGGLELVGVARGQVDGRVVLLPVGPRVEGDLVPVARAVVLLRDAHVGRAAPGRRVGEVELAGGHVVDGGVALEPRLHGLRGGLALGAVGAEVRDEEAQAAPRQRVVAAVGGRRATLGDLVGPADGVGAVDDGPVLVVLDGGVLVEDADLELAGGVAVAPPHVAVGVEVIADRRVIPGVGVHVGERGVVGLARTGAEAVAVLEAEVAAEPGDVGVELGRVEVQRVAHDPAADGLALERGGVGVHARAVGSRMHAQAGIGEHGAGAQGEGLEMRGVPAAHVGEHVVDVGAVGHVGHVPAADVQTRDGLGAEERTAVVLDVGGVPGVDALDRLQVLGLLEEVAQRRAVVAVLALVVEGGVEGHEARAIEGGEAGVVLV